MAPPRRTLPERAILLFGEGARDESFLKHLKRLFHPRGAGFTVAIKSGNGGSPADVLNSCLRQRALAQFDACAILMDRDKPWDEREVLQRAQAESIELLASDPSLECWLLRLILDTRVAPTDPERCKKTFDRDQLRGGDPTDPDSYATALPSDLLRKRASSDAVLRRLIEFLETGR